VWAKVESLGGGFESKAKPSAGTGKTMSLQQVPSILMVVLTLAFLTPEASSRGESDPDFPLAEDQKFVFFRVRFDSFGRRGRGRNPGWHHDYPRAETHLLKILGELTNIRTSPDSYVIVQLEDPIFHCFFDIQTLDMVPPYSVRGGQPEFLALRDERGRILAVAHFNNDIGDFWEWSDEGFYPIGLSNEAYKFGINYVIYAMTH
jgi:hypothetical protein